MEPRASNELPITLACWDYDRTRALFDGRVRPEGIALRYLPLKMPESFFRTLRHGEFDASEMSFSWYVRTFFWDPRPLIAIPVFPSRMFRHGSIYVNTASGIEQPEDLRGKRVGVPEYQMTAAVWIKGIMADRHGVPVNSVTYHTGGLFDPGRTELPMDLPKDIRVEPIPTDRTLSEMIETGEIDALYTAEAPAPFTRGSPKVHRLFPDAAAIEEEYFRETNIFPIMHTIVIRREVYERDRWIARSLQKAFDEAKRLALEDLRETVALKIALPWLQAHVERTAAVFGSADLWPYGLASNRETLGAFLKYSHAQGLIPRIPEPAELFAPETVTVART
jgi:4,5-dihydroxyphthalate decarboxylase